MSGINAKEFIEELVFCLNEEDVVKAKALLQFASDSDVDADVQRKAMIELAKGPEKVVFPLLEYLTKIEISDPKIQESLYELILDKDGQKMSKSYNNTITLREPPDQVEKKVKTMPTDPARIRRNDPGDPEKCPVWELHQVYSSQDLKDSIVEGCTTAGIGCIDCKRHIIDSIQKELKPIQERARDYQEDLSTVENIINEGCEAARDVARDTMEEVRKAMGLTLR